MKGLLSFSGFALALVAAYFLYFGLTMQTVIPSTDASGLSGSVANLQLMHFQLINVMIGLVAGLGSAILFAGAAIVVAIEEGRAP